jgi:hypothetical protein
VGRNKRLETFHPLTHKRQKLCFNRKKEEEEEEEKEEEEKEEEEEQTLCNYVELSDLYCHEHLPLD